MGEETYLTYTDYLLGFCSDPMTELSIGKTNFHFQLQLPSGVPASVDDWNSCSIRYSVDLTWITESANLKPCESKNFTVIRDEDLNLYPELIRPISAKTCQTACCDSDPMFLKVTLEKTGFALGEKALLSFNYYTSSTVHITSIMIALYQVTEMKGKRKNIEKSDTTKKSVKEIRFVPPNEEDFFRELEIPSSLPTTNLRYVNILEIRYELKVKITFSWFLAVPLRFYFPITIGTIPLALSLPSEVLLSAATARSGGNEQDLRE